MIREEDASIPATVKKENEQIVFQLGQISSIRLPFDVPSICRWKADCFTHGQVQSLQSELCVQAQESGWPVPGTLVESNVSKEAYGILPGFWESHAYPCVLRITSQMYFPPTLLQLSQMFFPNLPEAREFYNEKKNSFWV